MINTELQEKINILKEGLNVEISKISKLEKISIPNHIIFKNLQSKIETLTEIEEILNFDKYKIAFIGTVGLGKTTAICHLFNLIGEFSVTDTSNDKKKTVQKIQELLSTGSGRTTICEVIIKAQEKTYIEIEPYSTENMEKLIIDFCDSFSDDVETSSGEGIPREIETAIRNVVDFKYEYKTTSDGTKKQIRIDRAKEAHDTLGLEDFKKLAISNAELMQRNKTKIIFEGGDEKAWIKDTFKQINQSELKEFSIPEKIYICVSKNILSGSDLYQFDSVIDTKGIDEVAIRRDLEEYINKKDTICLFTTAFNSAPETNILELMKFYLQQKSKDLHQKFSVFVLPKKEEPEKENGGDGTWNTGTEIKREIIQNVFKKFNLEFFPENIIFYDSLRFYNKGKLDSDYDLSDVQEDKNNCISQIGELINSRKEILINKVHSLGDNFEKIKNGETLTEEEINTISQSVEKIKNLRNLSQRLPSFVYNEFIEDYITYYRNHYPAWNTKHAIHKRFGFYKIKNIDIYYDSRTVVHKMLMKFTSESRIELEQILNNLSDIHQELETLIPELINKFEINFDGFIEDVSSEVEIFLQTKKLAPQSEDSDFWKALMDEKGKKKSKGETYTDTVCQTFKREFEDDEDFENLNLFLKQKTEEHWAELIDSTLDFFGAN